MKLLAVLSLSLLFVGSSIAAEQTYGSGYEPKPPVPFPPAYKDYQILPNTISPNRRYAFIYPKRSRLYELQSYGLFLAALLPFNILSRVPTGSSNLAANARCYYAATWAKDSTTTVFIAGRRWGPDTVSVLQLRDGQVSKQSDLTSEVRQQVLPDFKESHAERYNEYIDFVFDSDDQFVQAADGEIIGERGWDLDGKGHVLIDCMCTTDPKDLDAHRWAVRFKGTWDIATAKFIRKEFTRIPPRPNQSMEPTAGRRDNHFCMTPTFNFAGERALASDGSSCSR